MIENSTKVANEIQKIYFINPTPYKIGQNFDFIDIKLLQHLAYSLTLPFIKIKFCKQIITQTMSIMK